SNSSATVVTGPAASARRPGAGVSWFERYSPDSGISENSTEATRQSFNAGPELQPGFRPRSRRVEASTVVRQPAVMPGRVDFLPPPGGGGDQTRTGRLRRPGGSGSVWGQTCEGGSRPPEGRPVAQPDDDPWRKKSKLESRLEARRAVRASKAARTARTL